jgi:hypothetical protein
MQVTLGALDFSDMTAYQAVNNHLGAAKTTLIPMDMVFRMLKHWRQYRQDGMSRSWILGEMKRQRVQITGGAYIPTDAQIVGFVTALDRLEKGDMPANPWERPSWAEAWDTGPGKVFTSDTAKTAAISIALIVGGAIVLHGFAGGIARR